jgi:hypothetical protein
MTARYQRAAVAVVSLTPSGTATVSVAAAAAW